MDEIIEFSDIKELSDFMRSGIEKFDGLETALFYRLTGEMNFTLEGEMYKLTFLGTNHTLTNEEVDNILNGSDDQYEGETIAPSERKAIDDLVLGISPGETLLAEQAHCEGGRVENALFSWLENSVVGTDWYISRGYGNREMGYGTNKALEKAAAVKNMDLCWNSGAVGYMVERFGFESAVARIKGQINSRILMNSDASNALITSRFKREILGEDDRTEKQKEIDDLYSGAGYEDGFEKQVIMGVDYFTLKLMCESGYDVHLKDIVGIKPQDMDPFLPDCENDKLDVERDQYMTTSIIAELKSGGAVYALAHTSHIIGIMENIAKMADQVRISAQATYVPEVEYRFQRQNNS